MTAKSDHQRIGQLPPQYRFFLNPYHDMRFVSACPGCGRKPRQRKLPLAIHVEDWGMVVLNKTCRYCPSCDLLIAHEDELRDLIDRMLGEMQPAAVGKPFFVIGTLDRAAWLQGAKQALNQGGAIAALHDFLGYQNYEVGGGWVPTDFFAPPTNAK